MREGDFYTEVVTQVDVWGNETKTEALDTTLIEAISRGPLADFPDIEVAVALARLIHNEYELYGTSGSALDREASGLLLRTLGRTLDRLGIKDFAVPFRDFDTFRTYWNRNDGYGSWQARRDMLNEFFEPLHEQLERSEAAGLEWALASGISPHPVTGWPKVDEEIAELRRHFNAASSQQDYSNIGNDCVAITEALSAVVYNHEKHGIQGQGEPAVTSTKARLDRYLEVELQGSENAYVRKLTRSAVELAQAVKHRRETSTRTEAGISADAVILLANILRRLQS